MKKDDIIEFINSQEYHWKHGKNYPLGKFQKVIIF